MVEVKGINKAITLAKKHNANYWIDLNTEEILTYDYRIKLLINNLHKNLMVVRPSETKTSLINIWNRNNKVFKWERQKDMSDGNKIYFCTHNKKKYVKIIKPENRFEILIVREFPESIYY